MYGTPITIVGNVVDEVALRPTTAGVPRLSFRVASTERRRDHDTGTWRDGNSLFVTVTLWREFAENVSQSINQGDPVVVHGRLYSKQYVKNEANRISYEIDCDSIGHDLSKGTARFAKRQRVRVGSVELDEDGLPVREDPGGYELIDTAFDSDVERSFAATA